MEFTAKNIASFLKGKVEGNQEATVNTISKIEEAKSGSLAFLANAKYNNYLYSTNASIVLINKDYELEKKVKPTLIRVKDSYQAFASLLELYEQNRFHQTGIEELSFIDPKAKIGENVYVAAFSYVSKNAKIADNVKIFPHVFIGENVKIEENSIINSGAKIYFDCKIGKNCIIHSGTIIGSDGFGFAPQENGEFKKIPQIGNVIIEDNVEIGSNCTIDRATIGSTIIRKGVKLDNLIQIAHNVEIGEKTVIAAQTGISGSTKLGKYCMIGGQVGMVGHIELANNVKVAAQAGVPKSVKKEGTILWGSPAFPINKFNKSYVIFKQLPEYRNKIFELEKQINELKKQMQN